MPKFAAEIDFYVAHLTEDVIGEMVQKQPLDLCSYSYGNVVSEIRNLEERMSSIEYDIFNPLVAEDPRIKIMESGRWRVYIAGDVLEEKTTDPDTGKEEVGYVFTAKERDIIFQQVK